MKNIALLMGGVVLRTVAAPLIVTGVVAQKTGAGIVKTGVAINSIGESAELKGLGFVQDGGDKMKTAKLELSKSRAERKLEREERKLRAAEDAVNARNLRVAQLQMAREVRATIRDMVARKDVLRHMPA